MTSRGPLYRSRGGKARAASIYPGQGLSRGFFYEAAQPILNADFPGLRYTAGLLGYGSDVLGFDDEVSTDHMWGPRFYLFLREEDMDLSEALMANFARKLPREYRGYSVSFSPPDPEDGGVRVMEPATGEEARPLIFIHTIDEYLMGEIGTAWPARMDCAHGLAVAEQRLLSLAMADLYRDDLGMAERLAPLAYYPKEARLYLIASNWSIIASEQAFSRRCSRRGDEIGSRLVCARIVERLMRLCFLYNGVYAPYSKWFAAAFGRLPVPAALKEALSAALSASDGAEREDHLVRAQAMTAELHNASGLTAPVEYRVEPYFTREIKVIYADKFARATGEQLKGTELENVPLFGAISDIGGLCEAADRPEALRKLKSLYATEK